MSESYIGWWGQRRYTRWHLVESEVTDRLVMRCGKQMRMENAGGVMVFETDPAGRRCEVCTGRRLRD